MYVYIYIYIYIYIYVSCVQVCDMYPELKSRLSSIAEANVHRVKKARGSVMFKIKQGINMVAGRARSSR